MLPKSVRIDISLTQDGIRRTYDFEGFAYLDSGFLVGSIGPAPIAGPEATLLTAFTLTGCPIAARCEAPDLNPWVHTGGAYRGRRHLRCSEFSADSILVARPAGNGISMRLDLTVEGTIPSISRVSRPFQESISQASQGKLNGWFDIGFEAGLETIECTAETEYELDIDFDVPAAWRNITIISMADQARFTQVEQIDMFVNHDVAHRDLAHKLLVTN